LASPNYRLAGKFHDGIAEDQPAIFLCSRGRLQSGGACVDSAICAAIGSMLLRYPRVRSAGHIQGAYLPSLFVPSFAMNGFSQSNIARAAIRAQSISSQKLIDPLIRRDSAKICLQG
jgi:hypothetical protein